MTTPSNLAERIEPEAGEGLPRWDLSDLYPAMDAPEVKTDLDACRQQAEALRDEVKGRLAELDGDALAGVIERYEAIEERLGRLASYAQLRHATEMEDAEVGRFYQTVLERTNEIGTLLLFVTLELNRIEDQALDSKVESSDRLARYRPFLRDVRSFRPHQLSDELETLLHEKAVAGRAAWIRLFDETMSGLRFPFDGRELTSAEIFDRLQDRDRSTREAAGKSVAG
ncbi:MAG: oligoendopeptidase F, partial [Geminicoccaceae bacterium]|nr:oligoendopeptidase F [Geminicoccaceae bacterium]